MVQLNHLTVLDNFSDRKSGRKTAILGGALVHIEVPGQGTNTKTGIYFKGYSIGDEETKESGEATDILDFRLDTGMVYTRIFLKYGPGKY